MMQMCCRRFLLLSLALVLFGLTACGGPAPRSVSGKITGFPKIKVGENDTIIVIFLPESKEGKMVTMDVKEMSLSSSDILPGKYKISLTLQRYPPPQEGEKLPKVVEDFNAAFSSDKTPLAYEVTRDATQSITIDLGKRTVTKN